MKKIQITASGVVIFGLAAGIALAQGFVNVRAPLSGFDEVPAVSTTGDGEFHARLDTTSGEIAFELSYDALEGNVLQAHIHIGKSGTNGGVAVFLCTNLGNFPAPPCPSSPGSVSGTITAADVIGPSAQGIAAGEFDELVRAIRAGAAYINVHSDKFQGGEIRGQIAPGNSGAK